MNIQPILLHINITCCIQYLFFSLYRCHRCHRSHRSHCWHYCHCCHGRVSQGRRCSTRYVIFVNNLYKIFFHRNWSRGRQHNSRPGGGWRCGKRWHWNRRPRDWRWTWGYTSTFNDIQRTQGTCPLYFCSQECSVCHLRWSGWHCLCLGHSNWSEAFHMPWTHRFRYWSGS